MEKIRKREQPDSPAHVGPQTLATGHLASLVSPANKDYPAFLLSHLFFQIITTPASQDSLFRPHTSTFHIREGSQN